MQELFNFLENPYLVVLGESLKSLPGIERIDLLFYNSDKATTELHSIQRLSGTQQIVKFDLSDETVDVLNSFRRKQSNQNWLSINAIPYSDHQKSTIKQNLFSEFDSHILCLAFPNTTDYSKDIFLFYFRKNASDFGLSRTDNLLTTSNKVIIGHILSNSLKVQLESAKHNQNSLRFLNEQTLMILESKMKTESENSELKNRYKYSIIQLTEFLISDLNRDDKSVFYLSEDAKEQIGLFSGSVLELKTQLSRAITFAKTLNYGTKIEEYILKADYFNFNFNQIKDISEVKHSNAGISEENNRHKNSKTFDFLNDMEDAAKNVVENGWKLTSANVGHKFEKPITAAAISDKLKHHSDKIIRLLEQYPAKWPLIRKRFKPLQNVIIKAEHQHFDKAAS